MKSETRCAGRVSDCRPFVGPPRLRLGARGGAQKKHHRPAFTVFVSLDFRTQNLVWKDNEFHNASEFKSYIWSNNPI